MNVNVLAFVFGALLLFVAIIGGGFELRELKVPRVGWASWLNYPLQTRVTTASVVSIIGSHSFLPDDPVWS